MHILPMDIFYLLRDISYTKFENAQRIFYQQGQSETNAERCLKVSTIDAFLGCTILVLPCF